MKIARLLVAMLLASLSASQARASITITETQIYAYAYDGAGSASSAPYTGTAIPTTPLDTLLNASSGAASSSNTINWSTSGGQTILAFDMEHARPGPGSAQAQTYGRLFFTAKENAPFALSGDYAVTGEGGQVYQYAYLQDSTTSTILFGGAQQSLYAPNEHFTLGGTGGDTTNDLLGSLTGSLIAGHQYQLYFDYHTMAPLSGSGATATGNFTLTIGEASTGVVPEPLSMFVWGGLFASAVVVRRRTWS